MPLVRLVQQWYGVQLSGFSALFYTERSNKIAGRGLVPKLVCGASSDERRALMYSTLLYSASVGQVAAVTNFM